LLINTILPELHPVGLLYIIVEIQIMCKHDLKTQFVLYMCIAVNVT